MRIFLILSGWTFAVPNFSLNLHIFFQKKIHKKSFASDGSWRQSKSSNKKKQQKLISKFQLSSTPGSSTGCPGGAAAALNSLLPPGDAGLANFLQNFTSVGGRFPPNLNNQIGNLFALQAGAAGLPGANAAGLPAPLSMALSNAATNGKSASYAFKVCGFFLQIPTHLQIFTDLTWRTATNHACQLPKWCRFRAGCSKVIALTKFIYCQFFVFKRVPPHQKNSKSPKR